MARYEWEYGWGREPWEPRSRRGARYDEWGGTARGGGRGFRGGMGAEGWGGGQGYGGYAGERYDLGYRRGMGSPEGFGTSFQSTERGGFGMREAAPGVYDTAFTGRDAWRGGFGSEAVDPRGGWSDPDVGRGRRPRGGREHMRAADLMTENPECVTADTTVGDVARRMKDLDVGIIPVVDSMESRRLRGVITDRDIAVRAVAEGLDGSARVADVMTADVETCNKNDSVEDVMEVMRREQVRRVPITDREGRLVGIIAQADLVVDYTGYDHEREARVEHTIERISEPARPERR